MRSRRGWRGGSGIPPDATSRPEHPAEPKDPYGLVCRWLASRERCRAEVEDYLRRKGVAAGEREDVMNRLASERLVDDLRYARLYIEGRARRSPRSRSLLAAELRRRGVAPEAAGQAIEEFFREVPEEELARRLLTKLPQSGEDWKERAARRLRARGFRASAVLSTRRAPTETEDG